MVLTIYLLTKYFFCNEFTIFTGQYLGTPSPIYLYTVKIENFHHILMSSLKLLTTTGKNYFCDCDIFNLRQLFFLNPSIEELLLLYSCKYLFCFVVLFYYGFKYSCDWYCIYKLWDFIQYFGNNKLWWHFEYPYIVALKKPWAHLGTSGHFLGICHVSMGPFGKHYRQGAYCTANYC